MHIYTVLQSNACSSFMIDKFLFNVRIMGGVNENNTQFFKNIKERNTFLIPLYDTGIFLNILLK